MAKKQTKKNNVLYFIVGALVVLLLMKFGGDGSFILGFKNPDFVNCNGKKIVIEVFGD